ncbi:putative transcriptional regulator [Allocatelliglobosispora scoriae]|uniref:Putative transcriptional regulator n=1 Tax=Allocatelliglobosispora scoriae TaxID=643052 RepID=A0A841BQT2_9ACTN|nr:MarR family transcriptional regulator [Allocatelliglobosispora scoriae]MBB5869549.1 putative transcriptional regulator [Allocatelliglobosispora scoriae]
MDIDDERRYAEDVGLTLGLMGLTPAYGKLLGWLLICDPPAQTSTQLAEALGLSKGSVSTGMRMLEQIGMARRVSLPGQRGHAYEMTPDGMIRATDTGDKFRIMCDLMQRGLDLIVDEQSPRAQRLRVTRDFYEFIAARVPDLVAEFKRANDI